MRELTRLVAFAALSGAAACASYAAPPGGPPDEAPPVVIDMTPDSATVNFDGRAVVVQFNETISDRGTGDNALEALVLVSPRDGEPDVSWHRSRIAIRPDGGFRPNTAYSIVVAPGIADLRGNRTEISYRTVFSTGPEIPNGAIIGHAFDWPGQEIARAAWIEALRAADSAVFVTTADSSGAFIIPALNPGAYVVRGYVDRNDNRVLDRTEVWDSVVVQVAAAPITGLELLFAQRDTFPARIEAVEIADSVTLRVKFDKPLDPSQAFGPTSIAVTRADSTPVAVTRVLTLARHDSLRTAARQAADTTPRPTPPAPARAPADTGRRAPRPSTAAPPVTLVVELAEPLLPATTYRVTATNVRTLMGRTIPATRLITTAARDTTRARTDTASVRTDTTRAPGDTARPASPRRR